VEHNYNYFRDYDPQVGRYVESDPLGLESSLNTYAYVEGLPTMVIDPYGLYDCVPGANCNGFTPDFIRSLQCFDTCTGRNTRLTCGTDSHGPNDPHTRGLAADIGRNSNPGLTRPDAERCYRQCFNVGASFSQEERNRGNGTHFHIQATPGLNNSTGFRPGVAPHAP
jgi:uncharacterized protein RhaS with RHS repeats